MVAAGPGWVGRRRTACLPDAHLRCAGAAQRSQAERPAGGPAGGVSHSLALALSPTPVRAALCGPFLPLRERGRTHPVNNSQGRPLSLRSKVCKTYTGCAVIGFALARFAGRHKCRCTTAVVCTLVSVDTVVKSPPLAATTTALVWRPVAAHWRGGEGGTAGAVLGAALAALDTPGFRQPTPSPSAAEVAALARAGSALNEAVRQRYMRGPAAGSIAAAASSVAAAARRLGEHQPPGAREPVLCVGKRDRLVKLRVDPRLHAAMRDAGRLNGMGLGAWVRDSVAAAVDEHQARRPTVETGEARTVAGRIAGLLVQAGDVAADRAEAAAVAAADDALAVAVARLSRWGSRR